MKIFIYLPFIFIFLLSIEISHSASLERIVQRGSLKICALADRLPFSSRSSNPPGIQIELARNISKELGVELEITWVRNRFHARKAGCDMVMEAVSKKGDEDKRDIEGARPLTRAGSSDRSGKKSLPPQVSIPIVKVETYLVGFKKNIQNKTSVENLSEMSIGVMNRSWSHMLLQKNGINYRTKFITESELVQGVVDKEIDAAFVSSFQYWWYLKNNPDVELDAIREFDFQRDVSLNVGILMRGADSETVDKINSLLEIMLEKEIIQNIYASYGIKYVSPN